MMHYTNASMHNMDATAYYTVACYETKTPSFKELPTQQHLEYTASTDHQCGRVCCCLLYSLHKVLVLTVIVTVLACMHVCDNQFSVLCCMLAVLLHLLFSTFLWMPSYYSKLWDKTDVAVIPAIKGAKLDQFGLIKGGKVPTGLQVRKGLGFTV
jgi:hypothetical protein